jgi:molybdate transport system substrate-binding protein
MRTILDFSRFIGATILRLASLAMWPMGVAAVAIAAVAAPGAQTRGGARPVTVFAAASLQTAFDALVPAAGQAAGVPVRVSYAASSALARQIESGAPADLFVSADLEWMDYLVSRNLVRAGTRVNLLGNTLVLIAPKGDAPALTIAPAFPLAAALGKGRLALADPDAVPAGKYARAALTSLGVWAAVAPRVAAAENVRAALALVARGETPLGIVYRTDAIAEPDVVVVGTFPATSHPPIVYPAALTTTASPAAARVLQFLQSEQAKRVYAAAGFSEPPRD